MTFQLQSQQQHVVDLNIQILDALFHIPDYRRAFWNTTHAIDSLVNILKKSNGHGPQRIYELTFAIWLLTFDEDIAKNLDRYYCIKWLEFVMKTQCFIRKCQIIPTLVELAKSAVKEKIIRVVIATFRVRKRKKKKKQRPSLIYFFITTLLLSESH
jgi:V-type H+-transporting ATPase subunit H